MAPGKVEDAKGVPFVGPAGVLLRNELRRQLIDPSAAYYINAVSCMPPQNKLRPEYLSACRQNLKDQLDIASDAKWILACGKVALEALLPHATPQTRGKAIRVHGKTVFGVYHPSYILQTPDRSAYGLWSGQLFIFGMMVLGDVDSADHDVCAYCNDAAIQYSHACKKHMGWWKVDKQWKYAPPEQLGLGI
jgi:uracil-DNA glycosylase family 4